MSYRSDAEDEDRSRHSSRARSPRGGGGRHHQHRQKPHHHKEVAIKADFLHRCCIQFSPKFTSIKNMALDVAVHREFIVRYAEERSSELARALVWRVVEAQGSIDLLGAWQLLISIFEFATEEVMVEVHLLQQLAPFLAPLIQARWFSGSTTSGRTSRAVASGNNSDDPLAQLKYRLSQQESPVSSTTSSPAAGATSEAPAAAYGDSQIRTAFRDVATRWLACLRRDIAYDFRKRMDTVALEGNSIDTKAATHFTRIPDDFRDSLAKLQRRYPRPSNVLDVIKYFGWGNNSTEPARELCQADDVEALCPMHPTAKSWLMRFVQTPHCIKCDSWKHDTDHCPCVLGVRLLAPRRLRDGAPAGKGPRPTPTISYGDAVGKLARYELHLPLNTAEVLDAITTMICKELPYEEVLQAFDVVRGEQTGVNERHALWMHASYNLLPSKTVFACGSGERFSKCMLKAREHLQSQNRYREFHQLRDAVDLLVDIFVLRRLPQDVDSCVKYFQEERSGFVFCFFEQPLCDQFPKEEHSISADRLTDIAPYVNLLCRNCLEPFHKAEQCPTRKQAWDLYVAQDVFDSYDLVGLSDADFESSFTAALDRIDNDEDYSDLKKTCLRNYLNLAKVILIEGKASYCRMCRVYGHSGKACEVKAKYALRDKGLSELEVRLEPHRLDDAIAEAERVAEANGEEVEKNRVVKGLKDAKYAFCHVSKLFPARYARAIKALKAVDCEVQAARYSPEAFEQYLMYTNQAHLQEALDIVSEPKFPDVCVYCGSLVHKPQDCPQASKDESAFITELESSGTSLSAFSIAILCPERLAARMADNGGAVGAVGGRNTNHRTVAGPALRPTSHPEGRLSLIQMLRKWFVDDYGPNGSLRRQWDRLEASIRSLQQSDIELAAARYNPTRLKQFAVDTQRPELQRAIEDVHRSRRLPEVCVFCSSVAHLSSQCTKCQRCQRLFLERLEAVSGRVGRFAISMLCLDRLQGPKEDGWDVIPMKPEPLNHREPNNDDDGADNNNNDDNDGEGYGDGDADDETKARERRERNDLLDTIEDLENGRRNLIDDLETWYDRAYTVGGSKFEQYQDAQRSHHQHSGTGTTDSAIRIVFGGAFSQSVACEEAQARETQLSRGHEDDRSIRDGDDRSSSYSNRKRRRGSTSADSGDDERRVASQRSSRRSSRSQSRRSSRSRSRSRSRSSRGNSNGSRTRSRSPRYGNEEDDAPRNDAAFTELPTVAADEIDLSDI